MRLLLDTHIWVWSLSAPERLSRRVARLLADTKNELWLSPISVWEVLVLNERKRVTLRPTANEWIARATERLREAPLTTEIAVRSRTIELSHQDPADRFIAATADVLDLRLVTSDERLQTLKQPTVIPNRP